METHIHEGVRHPGFPASWPGDINDLYDLARDKGPEARKRLTDQVVQVLGAELSLRESELISDVLIALMKQAEKDLRFALSEKLAVMDDVPLRLVLHLANDEIDIARPVLQKSSALGEFDLLYIIKAKAAEYWCEIAKRASLSDKVMNTLAATGDFDTALALAENENISLTDSVLSVLSDLAQESEALSVPLLKREEVGEELASMLYQYVGAEIKDFILANYNVDRAKIDTAFAQVEEEFSGSNVPSDMLPEPYMIEEAQAAMEKNALSVDMMLRSLRRGHTRTFIAQMSVYTEVSPEMVGQILSQTSGQGLAIVAKAYDIEKSDFISIFMLTNKLWNYGRIVETSDLHKALGYYKKATKDIALKILHSQSLH